MALSTPLPATARARRTADLVLTDLRQLSSAIIGGLERTVIASSPSVARREGHEKYRNPEDDPSCFVDPVAQEGKRMEPDSGLDFVVDDLPGIGRRYQMTGINGGRITVVVHHSGRRVVYGRNADADQASAVELSDHQARKLGAILGGAFFKPAVVEEVEAVFDDLLIDWVALEPNSPGADKSIAELEIRRTTGVTIIAIIRDDKAITAPQPSEIMRVGDRLVVVSRHQDLGSFRDLVVG